MAVPTPEEVTWGHPAVRFRQYGSGLYCGNGSMVTW
jgi:hypothetical protein